MSIRNFRKPNTIRGPLSAEDIDDNFNAIVRKLNELVAAANAASSGNGVIGADGRTIVGPAGDDGDDGPPGPPGPRGPQGVSGTAGAAGPFSPMALLEPEDPETVWPIPGPRGPKGDTGATGATGPAGGPTGPPGSDGADGEDGFGGGGFNTPTNPEKWQGRIVACWGDGNPGIQLQSMITGTTGPTPTNISTTLARCAYFRLKVGMTVANIRWYGIGATTAVYHIAIYRASDNARISSDNNPNTTANAWNSVADSFSLVAGELYYVAVSVDTTGTVAGIAAQGASLGATTGAIQVEPKAWPGGLDFDRQPPLVPPYGYAQATVVAGALPNPGNAPAAPGATWTGGMPAIFLDAE